MKANETHISLETSKLLKDCGICSKEYFCDFGNLGIDKVEIHSDKFQKLSYIGADLSPAYTWQEILWEYAEDFFTKDLGSNYEYNHTEYILGLLQQNKYEEADKYFREHCVLIKS